MLAKPDRKVTFSKLLDHFSATSLISLLVLGVIVYLLYDTKITLKSHFNFKLLVCFFVESTKVSSYMNAGMFIWLDSLRLSQQLLSCRDGLRYEAR